MILGRYYPTMVLFLRVGKSLKALSMLKFNCKMLPLKLRTLCELFDSFVGAI